MKLGLNLLISGGVITYQGPRRVKTRIQVNKKSAKKLPNPVVTIFRESLGGSSGANLIRAI